MRLRLVDSSAVGEERKVEKKKKREATGSRLLKYIAHIGPDVDFGHAAANAVTAILASTFIQSIQSSAI